jgi:RHH-type proline utilization regulon transcriptional repressor/proline dehydrogenase/delta 1-pyrroline-5-carboxylate dehydrogenase
MAIPLDHDERHRSAGQGGQSVARGTGGSHRCGRGQYTEKSCTEADVEVSEAIDFAEFYPFTVQSIRGHVVRGNRAGKGVGLPWYRRGISRWPSPAAVVVAALAAGNTVIFKPASGRHPVVAWELCQCFWRAGVSKNTLQFVPCSGGSVGPSAHRPSTDVDYVILTGGTETGMAMLKQKPGMLLSAETGGKNATVVSAMADRDQAIKNVVYSAFGNSGQKCSATSLLILEDEIYSDDKFKRQLVDAAKSFKLGSSWDFSSKMGALIRPPSGDLKRALTTLEPGESWALEPRMAYDNPHMWTPGIKYGVKPGSYTHMTEFFGPLLGVMRAKDLTQAIELVNQTGFGLTSGIESLDAREQKQWKQSIRAGNLYLNRGTTGAITLRQPFGGMGKSALGPAVKAGGPNYVAQFMDFEEISPPRIHTIREEDAMLRTALAWRIKIMWGRLRPFAEDLGKTIRAVKSYRYHWEQEFGVQKDYFHLRGQDNIHRYLPLGTVGIRLHASDSLFETLGRIAAARITGNSAVISMPEELNNSVTAFLESSDARGIVGTCPMRRQSDDALVASFDVLQRIRYAAPERVPTEVLAAAAKKGYYIARSPVLMEGRLELIHYVQNQSVCDNYHRYGNLGERAEL